MKRSQHYKLWGDGHCYMLKSDTLQGFSLGSDGTAQKSVIKKYKTWCLDTHMISVDMINSHLSYCV